MPFRFLIPNFFNMIKIEKYKNIFADAATVNDDVVSLIEYGSFLKAKLNDFLKTSEGCRTSINASFFAGTKR